MKGDVIEVFGDTFAWLFGKTFLFFVAVASGLGIGVAAILASRFVGSAGPGFLHLADGRTIYLIGGIVPALFAVIFAGMWFVRSEESGWKQWGGLAIAQAALVGAGYCAFAAPGLLAVVVLWGVVIAASTMLAAGLWCWQIWTTNRWAGELATLQAENARRRAELHEKFGTVSAGAREFGAD